MMQRRFKLLFISLLAAFSSYPSEGNSIPRYAVKATEREVKMAKELGKAEPNEPYSCARNTNESNNNSDRHRSDRIIENAAKVGVPVSELVALQDLVEKYDGVSQNRVQQRNGDEIIFTSTASQTRIITSNGVVCVTDDPLTDALLNSKDGINTKNPK